MKHPTPEQWMEYLYGESPSAARPELESHLEHCENCRRQTETWRSAMKRLDAWTVEVPTRQKTFPAWSGLWKWAAAACLVLTSAFAAGRWSGPAVDLPALQAQLAKPLQAGIERELQQKLDDQVRAAADAAFARSREQVQKELSAKFQQIADQAAAAAIDSATAQLKQLAVNLESLRTEDQAKVNAAIKELEAQRVNDLHRLRQELETVAVYADQSLRQAQRQLVQLASYNQPSK